MSERIDVERQAEQFRQYANKRGTMSLRYQFRTWAESKVLTPNQRLAVLRKLNLEAVT